MKKLCLALAASFALATAARADDWMSRLPDNTPACVVSIPGAHDAATGNGFSGLYNSMGNTYARTQELTMQEQWAAGVRAFDLRPCMRSDGYLGINHGIIPTALDFDDALDVLADSLEAHPTEFVIVHLRHEDEGDSGDADFETLLHAALARMEERGCLADFKRNLTVADLRGKMLFLFRDAYNTAPCGGTITGWVGYIDWNAQTAGKVTGTASDIYASTSLYMQDLSDVHEDGALEEELEAIETMLDYTTNHYHYNEYRNVWALNFASAYSLVRTLLSYELSLADGYRDNAAYTNKAIVDYLAEHAGPTGIVMADYAGVDSSVASYYTGTTYATCGAQLVEAIIENNFNYIEERDLDNDRTDSIGCYDASFGASTWTTTSGITCNAGSQHWSGDPSDAYFEQSGSEWASSAAWTEKMVQILEVEDGYYTLSAMGRSSADATLTLDVNGSSYTFPAKGDTGGTIDIYGNEWRSLAAGLKAGTSFANGNAGRGWNKGSVSVLVLDGQLTITVTMTSPGAAYQWASIDDFRLTYDGSYNPDDDDTDAPGDTDDPSDNDDDDVSAVSPVAADVAADDDAALYDLSGHRVTNAAKGVFIKNGKKIAK